MALVINSIGSDNATLAGNPGKNALGRDNLVKGTQARFLSVTVLNGDYSSGFDFNGIRTKMGLRAVFGVKIIGAKNGGGTTIINFWDTWDFQTGKLRVNNATSEANASALFTDNSVLHVIAWGV